jgi:alginate O-acetyltransferase complex protein AlgI
MIFSSLLFLFIFLPVVLTLYYLLGQRFRNTLLLLASLLFYAWGEVHYVFVMLLSISINYCFGLMLDGGTKPAMRRFVVAGAVVANIAPLFYYKYSFFFGGGINQLLVSFHLPAIPVRSPHLPIGISFFTFQALSYVIDVFRRDTSAQKNPFKLGLYISLFPQLIAGPIVRYHDVAEQITRRIHSSAIFASGIERFIMGLAKKVLIANVMADIADSIFASPGNFLTAPHAWLGIVCYTLQIYFDFSGYSDMAIGLGRMFGFHFLENFNYPYISQSLQEFWRRWHISLSTWLRDYLYIPLGGSRYGVGRTYCNLLIVFALCGLWHGAGWTFLAWGCYHGFFLILERLGLNALLAACPRLFRHVYAMLVVVIGWVFFRAETLQAGMQYLGAMFFGGDAVRIHPWVLAKTDAMTFFFLLVAICCSIPIYPYLQQRASRCLEAAPAERSLFMGTFLYGGKVFLLALLLSLSILYLASGTYNPFIYFRF